MSDQSSVSAETGRSHLLASVCFGAAVVLIPVSVASKFLLDLEGITWVDPTLLLAFAACMALLPAWADFLGPPLRNLTGAAALLLGLSLLSSISGMVLRSPSEIYSIVREPLRLGLVLCWMLVSAWFLLHKPLVALRCAVVAVMFAFASGVYLQLMGFGLAPGPGAAALYVRLYLLRQSVWIHGLPVPRMGGLFIEAPPFGLFMFSMLVVFATARASGLHFRWSGWAAALVALGAVLSLADQVLLSMCVVAAFWVLHLARRRPLLVWPAAVALMCMVGVLALGALHQQAATDDGLSSTNINGNSIGERTFHLRYGTMLVGQRPIAAWLGIGPGRYGEYAADTGLFPASVTMQSSQPELLVEWGIAGLVCWTALVVALIARVGRRHGVRGMAWLLGLIVADSFQSNWKVEAVAFAVAALYTLRSAEEVAADGHLVRMQAVEPGASLA